VQDNLRANALVKLVNVYDLPHRKMESVPGVRVSGTRPGFMSDPIQSLK